MSPQTSTGYLIDFVYVSQVKLNNLCSSSEQSFAFRECIGLKKALDKKKEMRWGGGWMVRFSHVPSFRALPALAESKRQQFLNRKILPEFFCQR